MMHSYVISCAFHNYKHFVIFPHIFFPQKHFKVNNQYQDMGFHGSSVQEILQARKYWSRLPFPPSGDLPNSGIEPGSTALQVDSSLSEPPGKPFPLKPLKVNNQHQDISPINISV